MNRHLDYSSIIVITVTFILFTLALFTKGMTHDILLEAGVFLVSVKLILMAYRSGTCFQRILRELKKINETLNKSI